jgi:magnesium transporter
LTPSLEVLKETVNRLIDKGNYKALERILEKSHKGDIVSIFRYLDHQKRVKLFQILMEIDLEKASDVLYDLDEDLQIEVLRSLPINKATRILLTFSTGEISEIIDKLPEKLQNSVLSKLEEEEREEIQKYISYKDSIAPLISEDYIALLENKTVEDAINAYKTAPFDIDIAYIYVVDKKNRLVGVVSIKDLLNSPSNVQLKDIMNRDVISLLENASKEDAIEIMKRYDLLSIPVINEDEVLIGVIYIEEIIDALSEKTTEEFFKFAGATEEELFYSNQILKIANLRLPWLFASAVGELLAAFIISMFNYTIVQFLPIIFFLPLVTAMSGNISSQSAIITTRGLSTGQITEYTKSFIFTLLKEIRIALIVGLIISIFVGVIAFIWISNHILGIVVAVALLFNMVFAALIGGSLPFVLSKIGKDPALATGPLTATLSDIIGVLVYLAIATIFIQNLKIV